VIDEEEDSSWSSWIGKVGEGGLDSGFSWEIVAERVRIWLLVRNMMNEWTNE
jgi:hypothetical protein